MAAITAAKRTAVVGKADPPNTTFSFFCCGSIDGNRLTDPHGSTFPDPSTHATIIVCAAANVNS
jgi:hypothetical protein